MRLLLDTHTFLWFVLDDPRLSAAAKGWIVDPGNEKLVSPASYWETAIKISLEKYVLNKPYDVFMQEGIAGNGFIILPIEPRHTTALVGLTYHHRDPFDRLLIAQAIVEGISIVSADRAVDPYPVGRLW